MELLFIWVVIIMFIFLFLCGVELLDMVFRIIKSILCSLITSIYKIFQKKSI